MKILRVNIKDEKITFENLKEEWRSIGGSALIAKIMNREVLPTADPLGPENLFIVSAGPLGGNRGPAAWTRLRWREEPSHTWNQGGKLRRPAAQILDRLGIRAIIVYGGARDNRLYCLSISKDKATLIQQMNTGV